MGREARHGQLSLGAEAALRVRRSATGEGRPRLELRWRPTLEVRRRTLFPGQDNAQRTQHIALMPANLGMRWHVSPRHRFTWFVGPRFDWIGFSEPGSTQLVGNQGPLWGTFYGEAFYQMDMPITRRETAWSVTGRLNLGYIHSNLDGVSFDTGAIIGFFGPVDVSYDFRFRRRGAPWAWQLTLGNRLGTGGGAYLQLGAVVGGGR